MQLRYHISNTKQCSKNFINYDITTTAKTTTFEYNKLANSSRKNQCSTGRRRLPPRAPSVASSILFVIIEAIQNFSIMDIYNEYWNLMTRYFRCCFWYYLLITTTTTAGYNQLLCKYQ